MEFWGRTQTSSLRSVEGLQIKTFFSKRPLSSSPIPNKIFFLEDSPLVEIPSQDRPEGTVTFL